MDWSFMTDPERTLGGMAARQNLQRAQTAHYGAETLKTMQEMSDLGEAGAMLQGVPPAENLQQAADNMLRLSNQALSKGKLNIANKFLKQAGDVAVQVANIDERRAKATVETARARGEQMKQAGSEAAAILSFAGGDIRRGQYAWESHLMGLQARGEDISRLPTTFQEALPGLQMMVQQGMTANEAADNIRGLEQLKVSQKNADVNEKLAKQRGAMFEAIVEKTRQQTDALKKGGGQPKAVDPLVEANRLAQLRAKFKAEFPLGMPGIKYEPGQVFRNSKGETFKVRTDGKVDKIGAAPDWWTKSSAPPAGGFVDTAIPPEALEED